MVSGDTAWLATLINKLDQLVTDGGFLGNNPRLRVDPGQTGFFDGREFRTYARYVGITTPVTIQAVVPINIILFGLDCTLVAGEVLIETIAGGTPSGVFDTPLPIFPRNTMQGTPLYTPVVTLASGGSLAGGTVIDVLNMKTAENTNFAAGVGIGNNDERGVGPATYHFRLTPTGTTTLVFKARWEERP